MARGGAHEKEADLSLGRDLGNSRSAAGPRRSLGCTAAGRDDGLLLKFDDGREGWANLVSDDYPKTGFSSKGKVEVPGFKQVDITSGVIPDLYKVGQVILYNPQSTQNPFHFVRFVIEGNQFMTGYVATFDSKQYRFKAHRR
jgi:hypothetical protein